MKRDMELIKKILESVEKHGDGTTEGELDLSAIETSIKIADGLGLDQATYPFIEIHHHSWLCVDAGFVKGTVPLDPKLWARSYIKALTWKGHEALDRLRKGISPSDPY